MPNNYRRKRSQTSNIRSSARCNVKIAVIGGGTGLSTLLRGLKCISDDITAIVTVADDGGGSGVIRQELGLPPPGDIRNCILALANAEPTMQAVMNYRFTDGSLCGQSLGNLFLAALNGVCGSFETAVERMNEVLAVTGRVLPVTTANVNLEAEFEDGGRVLGESRICDQKKARGCRIKCVRLIPEQPPALESAVGAIENADFVVLGPGSLYTSIIPNLLVSGIPEALVKTDAVRCYVMNIMTQEGETEGYTAPDHLKELFGHAGGHRIADCCIMNADEVPKELAERYASENAEPIYADLEGVAALGVTPYTDSVASTTGNFARHDPERLAEALMRVYFAERAAKVKKTSGR